MNPTAVVFPCLQTTLNTAGLIQACRDMNQPNPTKVPDEKNLQGLKHTIATLDEIQSRPYLTGNILQLGYMLVTYPDDMQEVLAHTAGMAHLYHDGVRNASCVIVTGSVNQWLDACSRACCADANQVTRFVFNRVYRHMEKVIPREMMSGERTDAGDGTFLLEDKR